jgi:diaminohydroxyphosphoribosylaminopyrimidine deaminase/5-amino-6-(5-phosphoribosylamino)uracil reductase
VAASSANGKKIRESLSSQGGEIRIIKASSKEQWIKTFRKLASENITSILVEGGGILAASLLSFGLIDKIALHYAPIILGGKKDLLSFAGENRCLADAFKLGNLQITRSENDIILSGYPK